MENEEMQRLIERYLSAYNTFDIQGMLDVLDEEIRFLNVARGEVTTETLGIADFRALAEQSVPIFSERRQTIRQIGFTQGGAEVEIDYEATLAVDLPNGMQAGEVLQLRGKSVFQKKGEKLVRIEDHS
ncbi:nuclear transport factor 2 family protein [Saccharibacillus deserti]|uniref:nuclear transport factor 2 family protein n=1 Tax=Saccharibacillus deserti TaxID=1634444 RepID=UPI00155540E7|nr:nuclear transport factor 2 family protein [Saccharibacillus deserti]